MKIINILAASTLAALSIAIPNLWFLSFASLALFFYTLWFQIDSKRLAILSGSLFGIATTAASIWWLWDTLPLTWLNIESSTVQWIAVFITVAVTSLMLSVPPALYAYFIWKFRNTTLIALLSVILWPIQEAARGWFFYVVTIGKQSLPGAHFSITNMGYVLSENNYLLQLADTYGVYGLSFILSLFGATLALLTYSALNKKKRASAVAAIIICIAYISIPLSQNHLYANNTTTTFAIVAADTPVDSVSETTKLYQQMLEEIAAHDDLPDVIVFPEGGGPAAAIPNNKERKEWLQKTFKGEEVLIIGSNYTNDLSGATHSVIYYDSSMRGNIAIYDKMFLMGQGEYPPYISILIYKLFGNKEINTYLSVNGSNLKRGNELKAVDYNGVVVGSLLCSEILSSTLYRDLATEHDANILVNLSHTSWFNGSENLYRRMLQMAKVHAVQNRTYFMQASNGLPSFVLNQNGKIILETAQGETKVVFIDIPVSNTF